MDAVDTGNAGGGFDWGSLVGNIVNAYTQVEVAKQQGGNRRPPAPTNSGGLLSFGYPPTNQDAGYVYSDSEKVGAIFRSPVTWVALAALAVGIIFLMRR